jgi:LL-H family phage holin
MEEYLIEQVGIIVVNAMMVLAPILVALLAEYLRRKIGVERLKAIQEELVAKEDLVLIAVQFVEQAFKNAGGEEKLNEALIWVLNEAGKRGIKVSEAEIKGMIESCLRAFKDVYGEDWAKSSE